LNFGKGNIVVTNISYDSILCILLFCSCNIGEGGIALAEAVHGSAPDIAGKVSCGITFHP
jgi:isocitrate/isopropylmalate dehydrogenase